MFFKAICDKLPNSTLSSDCYLYFDSTKMLNYTYGVSIQLEDYQTTSDVSFIL